MKHFHGICAATFLTFMLSASAFAGDLGLPGVTDPNPPPDPTQTTSTSSIDSGTMILDSVTDTTIDLLIGLLP